MDLSKTRIKKLSVTCKGLLKLPSKSLNKMNVKADAVKIGNTYYDAKGLKLSCKYNTNVNRLE